MEKKNILLILTDQQRKDSLRCYGNEIAHTPNLDRLAKEGIRFNRCYVANNICMPNRMSIFTGMYPRNHGLWTNGLLLEHERRTIATELNDQGYQTANFGKMHFTPTGGDLGNWESGEMWRRVQDEFDWSGPYWGFEHVELTMGHSSAPIAHYGKWFRKKGGTPEMMKLQPVTGSEGSGIRSLPADLHESSFIAERTVDFITKERDKERPFFVVASFPDPHHPFNPPAEVAAKYPHDNVKQPIGDSSDLETRPEHYMQHFRGGWHREGSKKEKHPNGLSLEHQNERIAHTYAMVDLIDQNVGKIIDALEKAGMLEDTIVIFTSDHGELLGDHGLWQKGPFFYEGLVNVPLIIYAKGMLKSFVSDNLFSSVDIYPTIMELLGLSIPDYVDGESHKEHLFDPEVKVRDKCLMEYRTGYGKKLDVSSKILVTEDYKYVRYETGECELTDLKRDPEEKRNMAGDKEYTELKQKLTEELLDYILSTESNWPVQTSHA